MLGIAPDLSLSRRMDPPLWSPFLLGTALRGWFDSRATSTITLAAGLVSAWASRVNSWSVAQSTAANQPQLATPASWGSRQMIYFASGSRVLERTPMSVDIFRASSGSVIATSIEYLPHAAASHTVLTTGGTGSTRFRIGTEHPGTQQWAVGGRRLDVSSGSLRATTAMANTTPTLFVGSVDWASALAFGHANGVQAITSGSFETAGTVSDTRESRVAIGGTGFNWSGGYIGCAMLVNRLLTTLERQKWEGYEAHAFGLQSILPSDHPYRSRRPQASALELERFADELRDMDVTLAADRLRAVSAYVRPRGLVSGWRMAA